MLRATLAFLLIATSSYAADHKIFKDCSRVEFCTNLRTRSSKVIYNVDLLSLNLDVEPGVALLNLFAPGKTNLTLTVSSLPNFSWRLKVKEVNSKRYELKDVLEKEPETVRFQEIVTGRNYISFINSDVRMTINASPFNVQFFTSGALQTVFDGSSLTFEDGPSQAFAFDVTFPQALQIYGIHEHADKLALRNTSSGGSDPYRLRNLDVSGYEVNSPMSLYGAIPVLYGHGPKFTSGVFLHNAAEQWVEITNGQNTGGYFMVESGTLDLFVLTGPGPVEVVRQYVALTGTAHLPQLWALGYHQCRWNYDTQDDLKTVVANFNKFKFPLDVIWLDIEYTDGKKYFTWNPENFTDPLEMQKNISASHKRLVTIIDPHIKAEKGYPVYDGALQNDLFVKNADGSVFEGVCWPGLSSYMDFLNPSARSYYANFYSYENFPNTTAVLAGIWNDMNEPSVFDDSLEKTLPGDALHHNGVVHRDIHNIYGFLHTMSTHQGLLARDNGATRPFILTRSHFAGSQRYAAIWTGDNTADWGYLAASYAECLNANILGIVFCGADVGGFDQEPTIELLQRWYQAGVWLPFYRAHANMGTARREPYLYAEDVQDVIRNAIELRYKHLPVWYTLFFEHTQFGDPIIRPLFYHYPADNEAAQIDDQLLVGRNILVKAVAEPEVKSVQVYFPGGTDELWLSITNSDVYKGTGLVDIAVDIKTIPVYYRRGSVIVKKEVSRLSSAEMEFDPHTLHALIDEDGKATGTVYIDDNTSFDYKTKGEYTYLNIEINNDKEVKLSQINLSANSTAFPFVIKEVLLYKVDELPKNDQPGTYSSVVYTKNSEGVLLSDLKLDVENEIILKLSE